MKTNNNEKQSYCKRIISFVSLILLMGLTMTNSFGQTPSIYSFSTTTTPYVAIVGTTSTATGDDGTQAGIPIGFNFSYNGSVFTTISLTTNGCMSMGSTASGSWWTNSLNAFASTPNINFIAPLWDDNNASGGNIQYLTAGAVGSRTFTVQWTNIHIGGGGSSTNPVASFQVVLFETSNQIQFNYNSTAAFSSTTASVGISGALGNFLSVTPATLTASNSTANNSISVNTNLTGGRQFTFSPPVVCSGTPTAGTALASPASISAIGQSFTLSLTGTTVATGITYQWQSSPDNSTWTSIGGATGATLTTIETATTWYRCVVTCSNGGGSSASVSVQVVLTGNNVNMFNGIVSLCSGSFFDSQGSSANYNNNENFTLTINPSSAGAKLQVAFSAFAVETCCDHLRVYNGPSTASPLIGTFDVSSPGTVTSTAASGALTFNFTSDGSVVSTGWTAAVSCVFPCSAPIVAGTATSSSGGAVCNSNSATLSLTGTSPNPAVFTGMSFQWKSSSVSGGPYTNIAGATSATYNTGTVIASTYYVCAVTCSAGGSDQSNEVSVLVTPGPSAAPFSTPPGYCATGGGPVVLAAEAVDHTPNYTYSWSDNQTGYSVNENVTQTTTFTVTVTDLSTGCSISKQVSVGVYTFPTTGISATANPAGPSCPGTSTQLNIAGFTAESFSVNDITPSYSITPVPSGASSGPSGDDVVGGPYSMPFTFNFFGNSYNSFYISTNGNVQFGPTTSTSYTPGSLPNTSVLNFIALDWADLVVGVDGNTGNINYFTTGIAPNRVEVISFNNVGFYNAGTSIGNMSGQILMYETIGVIECHLTQSTALASTGGGVKTIGVNNINGTIGAAAPGRNGTAWTTTVPEAWRFTPPSTYTYAWTSVPSGLFSGSANIGNPIGVVGAAGTTTTYTVVVTNSVSQCSRSYSVSVDALNPAAPTGGTVLGPSSATCGDVVTYTSTGSANLQWQSSPDGSTWSPIAGQTSASITVSTSLFGTGTVYLRTLSTEPTCGQLTASSNTLTLVIAAPAAATIGTISGPTSAVCGTNVSYSLSSIFGSLQWEISTDNVNFSSIAGATSNPLNISTSTYNAGTIYIRAKSTVSICAPTTAFSNVITLVISPAPSATIGTISGPSTATCGDNLTYSVDAVFGNLQWQISSDNVNFTDVPGATTSPVTRSTNLLGPGTFYIRAKSTVSACAPSTQAFSNVITVVVVPASCSISPATPSICAGTSTVLTANGNAPYIWSTGATTQSITVSPMSTTAYTVNCGTPASSVFTYLTSDPAYSTQVCPSNTTTFSSLDDGLSPTIPIGFTFNFFGNNYTQFAICTNGNIQLGDGSGSINNPVYSNTFTPNTLPTTGVPSNMVAGIWTDLLLQSASEITYGTTGSPGSQKLIVCWNAHHYNLGAIAGVVQFQIVLNEGSNTVEVNIISDNNDDITGDPQVPHHNEVIGVENADGTVGVMPPGRNLSPDWPILSNESWNFTQVAPGGGCVCTSSVTVLVHGPIPSASVVPSATSCYGTPRVLLESVGGVLEGPLSYLWSTSGTDASITVSPTITTVYTVTVSDGTCSATAIVTANVFAPVPVVSASSNSPVCQGNPINLIATSNAPSSPVPTVTFTENFDAVSTPNFPDGWKAKNDVDPDGIAWVTSSTSPFSAPYAAFINDPSTISDKILESVDIFISTASAQVTFRNNYTLESNFDGGVLEISTDGGATYQDIITAGGSFVTGGYNSTISTAFSSPIAGRPAWSSTSGGYIVTTINLPPSTAGQNIKLRWRMCSDSSVSSTGWRIDDVQIIEVLPPGIYSWTGPGFVSSVQNPSRPSSTTAMQGTYTVVFTDLFGCQVSSSTNVLINVAPVIASLQSATLNGGVATPFPAPPTFLDIPGFTTPTTCDKVVNYNVAINGIPTPTSNYTFTGATIGSGSGTGSGSTFGRAIPTGRTTVVVNANNVCGSQSKTFRVTVTDNVPPVITPIQVAASNTNGGECASTVQVTQPTLGNGLFDNCPNASLIWVSRSDGRSQFEPYYVGTTTVTWQATDASANVSTATQNVVVNNFKPVITSFTSSSNVIFVGQTATFTAVFTDEDGGGTHTVKFYRDKNDASPSSVKTLAPACTQSCTGTRSYSVTSDPILYSTSEVAEPKVEVLDGCNLAADQVPGVTTFQYLAIAVAGTQFTTAGGHFTMQPGCFPSAYQGLDVNIGNVVKKATTGNTYKGQLEMNVHLSNGNNWRVHTDNGSNQDITWDYLTVSGCSLATFKGAVLLNGVSGYKVLVQQSDKDRNPATSNFIRVKVTTNAGALIFDTQPGLTEALTAGNGGAAAIITQLDGGSIKVQPASGCVSRIEDEAVDGLLQNFPNPFTGETEIRFTVPEDGMYTLKVYNYLGQEVTTLFNAEATGGSLYSVIFNGSNLESGIYTYTLTSSNTSETRRMNLIK